MTIVHILPEIDGAIWKALDAKPAVKPKQKRQGAERGPQPMNNKVSDDVVRAMRRMHEIDRKTIRQVAQAFPGYSSQYVRRILGYEIRCTLKP